MTAIATQIRVIRQQRGWSQIDLAKKLRTSQAVISRMEDPSYGRLSLRTLVELAKVFDTGLQVRFVSLVMQLKQTWVVDRPGLEVPTFDDQADQVGFVSRAPSTALAPPVTQYVVPAKAVERGAAVLSINMRSSPPVIAYRPVSHHPLISHLSDVVPSDCPPKALS